MKPLLHCLSRLVGRSFSSFGKCGSSAMGFAPNRCLLRTCFGLRYGWGLFHFEGPGSFSDWVLLVFSFLILSFLVVFVSFRHSFASPPFGLAFLFPFIEPELFLVFWSEFGRRTSFGKNLQRNHRFRFTARTDQRVVSLHYPLLFRLVILPFW